VIGLGSGGWLTQCVDHYQLKARYTLLLDNLFDLSHLGFIHANIVGAGGISLVEPALEERDGRLVVSRRLMDVPADGYNRFLFPSLGERMSVTVSTELVGISLINAGGPVFNGPSPESPLLGHQNFIHAITPETEHSTHYWTLMTRDFRTDDAQLSGALAAQNVAVVAQDRTALEAIERLLQESGDMPREISMKSDAGAIRARLRIIQMIRGDRNTNELAEEA
jgi:vanillate O-demethylase monooxygenase subunit